jgi:nucleoside-diphosphate-sugar epimerase
MAHGTRELTYLEGHRNPVLSSEISKHFALLLSIYGYYPSEIQLDKYYCNIMSSLPTAIPVGSWVLVTGASGFLASHVTSQFLQRGFRVRGTVRDVNQSSWLVKGPFKSYVEDGVFELVAVPDLAVEGAYDEAIKGVVAIVHIAYVTKIVPDPNEVITPSITGIRSIMNAAMREPSVKRVAFTGSAISSSPLTPGIDNGMLGRDSWNDAALEAAWAPPPYGPSHAMANYAASKVAAEKEVWKFVEENELPFTVNVVSPAGLIGEPLNKTHIEGQANWVVHVFRGNKQIMDPMQACEHLGSFLT